MEKPIVSECPPSIFLMLEAHKVNLGSLEERMRRARCLPDYVVDALQDNILELLDIVETLDRILSEIH